MVSIHETNTDTLWQRRRCLALASEQPARARPPARLVAARPFGPDLAWERLQEQAIAAFLRGDGDLPARNWRRALEIAEAAFEPHDPRLAASLTNHAYVIQQTRGPQLARRGFARALETWDEGWRWVRRMQPPVGEMPYDEATRARFMALLHQGRAATEAISSFAPVDPDAAGRFRTLRPTRMTDLRALLAATLLIVPARGAGA